MCGQSLLGGWRWCLPLCGHASPSTGCRNLDHRFPEVYQLWPQRRRRPGRDSSVEIKKLPEVCPVCWTLASRCTGHIPACGPGGGRPRAGLVCVRPFKAVGPSGLHLEGCSLRPSPPQGSPGRKADPGWTVVPSPVLECQCPGPGSGTRLGPTASPGVAETL